MEILMFLFMADGVLNNLPPLNQITIEESVLQCSSVSYQNQLTYDKMWVEFTLEDMLKLMHPSVGESCDASSGLNFDPTLGLEPTNWKTIVS